MYAQGAGPVDLGNAVDAKVFGPGTVNAGEFDWPHDAQSPVTVPVTLTNTGRFPQLMVASVEDAVGADGERLARGTVSLVDRVVVVPAKGTATVRVRIDPRKAQALASYGASGFRLVVRGAGERVVTPVGFWLAPKMVDLTVRTLDRRGEVPAFGSTLDLVGIDRYTWDLRFLQDTEETFRVPAGTYAVNALVRSHDQGTTGRQGIAESIAWLGDAEATFSEDTVLTLDARQATKREVRGDRPMESSSMFLQYGRWWEGAAISGGIAGDRYLDAIYTMDTDEARTGGFELGMFYRMIAPTVALGNSANVALAPEYVYDGTRLDGAATTSLVDGGNGSQEALEAAGVAGKFVLVRVSRLWDAGPVLARATELGAKAVLFDQNVPGRWFGFGDLAHVPGLTITAAEGDALRAALAVGPVTFDWSATAVSPYAYNLAFHEEAVTSSRILTVHDRDLASVTENWYAQGSSKAFEDLLGTLRPHYGGAAEISQDELPTGFSRTAYYTAGDGTRWQHLAGDFTIFSYMIDTLRSYTKGSHREEDWFKGPLRPGPWREEDGASYYVGLRQNDVIGVEFAQWADSDPAHAGRGNFLNDYGLFDLKADGVSLGRQETFGYMSAGWNVPAGTASYELTMDTRKGWSGTGEELSASTNTTWRFDSSTVDGRGALPMLLPGYELDLDLFNRAPAVADYRVGFDAAGQPGYDPGALTAKAWISYDEGTNWVEVPVAVDGDGFTATVDNTAANNGYVSLKVALSTSDGASVEQTIVRAYAV